MKIAILGTGTVGSALATAFLAAGHDVTFGSRNGLGNGLGNESGSNLPAAVTSHSDAAASADLIVTALPGAAVVDTLVGIEESLTGTIVLDVSNAVNEAFELVYPTDSVARLVQERFPAARVVKSLNTMNTSVMTDPTAIAATTVYLSGNDAEAKTTVRGLLSDLGWPIENQLDLGGIETARATEHYVYLFFATLRALGTPTFNVRVVS